MAALPNFPPASPESPAPKTLRTQNPEPTDFVSSTDVWAQALVQQKHALSSMKTILLRHATETQPEITMDVPESIRPSLVEPFLIKAMHKGIFIGSEEVWTLMRPIVRQQKDDSFKRALDLVLRSKSSPDPSLLTN